jgi:hypothetical protein
VIAGGKARPHLHDLRSMPFKKYASRNEPPKQSSQIAIYILLHSQESSDAAHLISSDTIQYRAVSKTIVNRVHSVTTFVSVVVVISGFDLC